MILLTGGTGFLGAHILQALEKRGEKVRLLARNPEKVGPVPDFVEVVEGDLLDVLSLDKAIEDVDYVIHSAAVVSFWKKRHAEMREINVQGTANLVNVALDRGVRKFVQVSSIAALGRPLNPTGPIDEKSKWAKSKVNTYYGRSKYLAELEVVRGVEEGLPAAIVNPGIIIGEGSGKWDTGSPKLFRILHKGLRFYTRGGSGYVPATDVAQACVKLMDSPQINGERFVLVGENMSFKSFFELVANKLGVKAPSTCPPDFLTRWVGKLSQFRARLNGREPLITPETVRSSTHSYQYDGSRITRELDFSYSSLEETVAQAAEAYLKAHGTRR